MLEYKQDSVVGSTKGMGESILFAELSPEIQIALQNSDKWEQWQQAAIDAGKEVASLKKTLADIQVITAQMNREIRAFEKSNDEYREALLDIEEVCDSLKWAKYVAAEAVHPKEGKDPSFAS
jgi:hypothetical protein